MGFRNMKVFIALACLAAVASAGLVTKKSLAVKTTCGPDETECPAGCCPEANWFCCPDNRYCAATADDCPAIRLPNLLPKNCLLSRPHVAQMKLNAQLDVAQKPTGSAVPTTDIVPPLLMTVQPSNCLVYSQKKVVKTTCGPDETE